NPRLSIEILSEASRNPALRRVLRQNQEEYDNGLASFLEGLRKMRLIDDNLELLPLAYSLIALWNGLETLVVSGLPVEEAKGAWLEGFKAIFLQHRLQQSVIGSKRIDKKTSWENGKVLAHRREPEGRTRGGQQRKYSRESD